MQFAHVGGLIAISPYTCVFWTFANIHVNTQKTSWAWYGFLCVCRRGELQFALVANRPYRGLCFQALKIVKINTINKIKSINSKKFFIFALQFRENKCNKYEKVVFCRVAYCNSRGECSGGVTSLPSDTQGGYTVVLQVDHNYTLQASASGYKSSEPVTFRANTNDPERVPMKVQDFRLSER